MILSTLIASVLLMQSVSSPESCNYTAFFATQQSRRAEISTEARELLTESQAISRQRLEIAQRRVELSEGRHRLKGIFDPNYSAESLGGRDRALADKEQLIRQRTDLLAVEIRLLELDAETFKLKCGNLNAPNQ